MNATGGFRRRATFVEQQRQETEHLILLDTGDALVGGGLLGEKTGGKAIIDAMNLMGYDAMALGPKELSLGRVTLRQRLEEAQFPIVSANVLWSEIDELVTQPYTVLEIGSHRIAIIGLTRSPAEELVDFQILDPTEALAEYMPKALAAADTVVLLTNLGYRQVFESARAVQGIDLVVAALPRQLPENAVRIPETGTLVLTAEQPLPRHTGRRVGRLIVTLGSDGALCDESWTSVSMGPEFVDHPQMKALLERHQ